jgi:hypothetical protein
LVQHAPGAARGLRDGVSVRLPIGFLRTVTAAGCAADKPFTNSRALSRHLPSCLAPKLPPV